MIDIHCHLEFIKNKVEVLEEARKKMEAIITSVADPKNAKNILDLAKKYQNFLFISLGFHPECLKDYKDEEIRKYLDLIKDFRDEIVAIGEVGLDFSQELKNIDRERMEKVFSLFIDLAEELDLPLVIHARDAFPETIEILKEKGPKKVCLHCFSGSEGNLKEALNLGYFISFATNICWTKKHPRLAQKTPLERMLLETDSPWLDPENPKGLKNRPWKISLSIKKVAEIKNMSFEKVRETITKNAREFFKLP